MQVEDSFPVFLSKIQMETRIVFAADFSGETFAPGVRVGYFEITQPPDDLLGLMVELIVGDFEFHVGISFSLIITNPYEYTNVRIRISA